MDDSTSTQCFYFSAWNSSSQQRMSSISKKKKKKKTHRKDGNVFVNITTSLYFMRYSSLLLFATSINSCTELKIPTKQNKTR